MSDDDKIWEFPPTLDPSWTTTNGEVESSFTRALDELGQDPESPEKMLVATRVTEDEEEPEMADYLAEEQRSLPTAKAYAVCSTRCLCLAFILAAAVSAAIIAASVILVRRSDDDDKSITVPDTLPPTTLAPTTEGTIGAREAFASHAELKQAVESCKYCEQCH